MKQFIKQFISKYLKEKKVTKNYKGMSELQLIQEFPYIVDNSIYEYKPKEIKDVKTIHPFGKSFTEWTDEDRKEISGRNFQNN